MLLALASIFGSAVFFGSAVHSVAARAQVAAPSRSAPGDLAMTVTEAAVPLRAEDVLRVAAPGAVRLDGWIGEAIEATIRRRVMVQDVERIVGPFRERTEEHGGHWRCEYWGKWFTSAALAAAYQPTDDHGATLRRAADALIATQTPDGYIGTYRDGKRLEAWDTGDRRYLAYCERIMADWSRPGAFSPTGPRLIENALEDVPPSRMGSRKAYEMMSCFEGVCEMYRISGEQRFLDAVVAFARSLQRREMMVHGSGSNQELWCDGTRLQTGILEQPVETCVTVTWMKLCCQLLRLTGDPTWADALEVALYNALLGSVTPDGAWWAYFSPLLGQRVPSHYQHADMELSCCVANGPRGLLLTPQWAVMGHSEGPVVNLFEQGSFEARLADGTAVTIDQETTYPRGDTVVLTVSPERPCRFSLRLRIPAWSRNTALSVDGRPMVAEAGRYAVIDRDWSAGDRVELRLDLRGRAVPAPSGAPEFAVMRGPVLLALDDRLVEPRDVAVWLAAGEDGLVDLQPVYVDYRFARRRIDSVVFTPEDRLELRVGEPHVAMPEPPAIAAGEVRVANIWLPENIRRLGPEHLFPIEEIAFPETPSRGPTEAESLLPRTLEKLRSGKPLRILAWGDSVTEGYLGDDQWQRQFVGRLQERFPVSKIELVTVGWGAHTSHDFLQAPSGHERNFEATVLARRPDLVISEFVNDSPLDPEAVRSDYLRVLEALRGIDAEWIILTPHYSIFTNPPAERDIDDDPRAYVKMLRAFGREHGVALADASLRYGRLWRQGIPYTTLMVNAANHPDARGMAIFADSLMALFP
jgi:lysophospholipase L1-like esterase